MQLHFIYVVLGAILCGGVGHYLAGGKGMWLGLVAYTLGVIAGALWV